MKASVSSSVRPRYKGISRWQVEAVAELKQPVEYHCPIQGKVSYDPKIVWLGCPEHSRVLWFAYWISTRKTSDRMRMGQGAPMLEEDVLLELLQDAITKGLFTNEFMRKLSGALEKRLSERT